MNDTLTKTEARPIRETQDNGTRSRYLAPRVNISETKDGYLVAAELPGVTKAGLELLIENGELTLIGRRSLEKSEGEFVYRESSPSDFRRVFTLDPAINTAKISAKLEDGVLLVELPKTERVKPHRIAVKA